MLIFLVLEHSRQDPNLGNLRLLFLCLDYAHFRNNASGVTQVSLPQKDDLGPWPLPAVATSDMDPLLALNCQQILQV